MHPSAVVGEQRQSRAGQIRYTSRISFPAKPFPVTQRFSLVGTSQPRLKQVEIDLRVTN